MPTLIVGELMDNAIPNLVYKACAISMRKASKEDVYNVVNGRHVAVTRENQMYVLNMHSAYRYIVLHMGLLTPNYVRKLNHISGLGINKDVGVLSESAINELQHQIDDLYTIRDGRTRALVAFAYFASESIFQWGNLEVAQLVCNCFLIGHLIGFLNISVDDVDELHCRVKAAQNGDAAGLISLLDRSIVEFH